MEDQVQLILTEDEQTGLKQMRRLNQEFLAKNKGSEKVRDFLTKANSDNVLMLTYLKGRKYRPKHAWETLKRKAEVRFDEYPDVFTNEIPPSCEYHQTKGIFGLLKNRDQHGRRILVCNGSQWDTERYSMFDITQCAVFIIERLLKDEDAMNNGMIFIQNCAGMGLNHGKQYTLPAMLRLLHCLWQACPLPIKGVYYVNVPYYLYFIYGIIKPFLSKKLQERFFVTTINKAFDDVHTAVSPELLPKYLGGEIDSAEAFEELSFFIN